MTRRLLVLALAALAACTSARKVGERAAATGDWKTAERAYAEAVRDDPSDSELRARWTEARSQALATSLARARACAGAEDWECAHAEAGYAATLDAGNAELALFRRDTGRAVGLSRLRLAEEALHGREPARGLELLARAREATDDAKVRAEAQRLQPALVKSAVEQADALRRQRQYPQALALYEAAAAADGSVRPKLEAARSEQEQLALAEAGRLEREGDAHLAQRRFADAQASYEAAGRLRPQGKAAVMGRYAGHLRAGEAAVQGRDWARATQAYEAAVALGVDRDGLAARELDAVKPRPHAIQLRSILVRPARPDGQPWVGDRTRVFDAVMIAARAAERAFEADEPSALQTAIEVATGVPAENQPTLVAHLDLAGRRFATPARRALYAAPDASLVVWSNRHDDRLVTIRLAQQDGGVQRDVGVVSVRLADLLARGRVALRSQSIARVELVASPSDAREWTVTGLAPEGIATATAQPPPSGRPPKKR